MNLKLLYGIGLAAVLVQLGLAAWAFGQTGLDATVPIHWGPDGQVNGYGPAWFAFLLSPVISLGMAVLLGLIPRIEPRKQNLALSASAYRQMGMAMMLLFTLVQAGICLAATGHDVPMALLIGMGVGLMFAVIGNVMGTVRSNYLFGVRTPWTLASDLSWDKTHRLAGRCFFIGGVVMIVLSLLGNPFLVFGGMMGFLVVVLPVVTIYSYRVWKGDPARRPS